MNKTLLIIPAFNESTKIGEVINKVNQHCKSIIDKICVVDDFSSDDTAEKAANAGAFVLKHSKNLGVGAAIRTGLDYGYRENYDIAVIISGDDQHDPQEMPNILTPLIREDFDFIQGSRFMKGGKTVNQPFFRKLLTKIYPVIFYLLTGKYCSDITNGFRGFKIKSICDDPSINLHQYWLNRYELEVYLLYKIYNSNRYKKKEVPISILYHNRIRERTKMKPLIDWWRIFRPLLLLRLKIKA
ncbi:MAG: glycosyltransferase family 2 protein [Bacteroidales bacterium]|nr:glycosyltransferase family 2 protein [Bacteroidales bacterium]